MTQSIGSKDVSTFLQGFIRWARTRPDILAAALIGSYARSDARHDSDVDLVIISQRPAEYLTDLGWTTSFGSVVRHQIEDYGMLTSVRVEYANGREVEFGITGEAWAALPLDEGTRRVIFDGLVVLFETGNLLSRHLPPKDAEQAFERGY